MNILHVIDKMDPRMGGVCQAVRMMAHELAKVGVCNEVVSLDNPRSLFLTHDTVTIHALGPGRGIWNYSPKLIPWLTENFSRFTTIIIHGLWLYPSYATNYAFKEFIQKYQTSYGKNKFPTFFIMPHGMLDPYFQLAKNRRIKAIRNLIYWKLIEGTVVNEADGLLFTCQEECNLAKETFKPYDPKKELVVGLGVEEPPEFSLIMNQAFQKKCPGLGNDQFLLFLGRIDEKKGVDLLIEAYIRIIVGNHDQPKKYLHHDCSQPYRGGEKLWKSLLPKLVIAGPGIETSYGKRIIKLISNYPILQDMIFFPGMLSGDAKWGALYACDSLILPSHQENFGIAIVEALACGKPTLITNRVNIWREINAESAGVVAADTDEGIFYLLESWIHLTNKEKKQMGQRASASYEKYFSASSAASRLYRMISY